MKLAVTGCNGRVGKRVVKLALQRGHEVIGVDKVTADRASEGDGNHPSQTNRFIFINVDLLDYEKVLEVLKGSDAVIQLAAFANPEDYQVKTHNTNVVISWNILRACAELGINRIAQASSVNVTTMVYSQKARLYYFPIDEDHPCEPDEPYGLSKMICEMQADTIVRRYDNMRVASLRLHWSIPDRSIGSKPSNGRTKDLWGYVQEDSAADAFLLAVQESDAWHGHERFFITAPTTASDEDTDKLVEEHYPSVPLKGGKPLIGRQSLFNCRKAERLLGWTHRDKEDSH